MDKLSKAFAWLLARAEEPSTWAGTGILAVILKSSGIIDADLADHILAIGAAIGGLLAIVLPEKTVDPVPAPTPVPAPVPATAPAKATRVTKK